MQISMGHCILIWATSEILRQFLFNAYLLIQEVAGYFLLSGLTEVNPLHLGHTNNVGYGQDHCFSRSTQIKQ